MKTWSDDTIESKPLTRDDIRELRKSLTYDPNVNGVASAFRLLDEVERLQYAIEVVESKQRKWRALGENIIRDCVWLSDTLTHALAVGRQMIAERDVEIDRLTQLVVNLQHALEAANSKIHECGATPFDVGRKEEAKLHAIVEVVADAGDYDTLGSLRVYGADGTRWLRDAARAALGRK